MSEAEPTDTAAYDELRGLKVEDPAVLKLGERWIVGRWEKVSEVTKESYVCPIGARAIVVLGEAATLGKALADAKTRLSWDGKGAK